MTFEMDVFITTIDVHGRIIEQEVFKPIVNKSLDYITEYTRVIWKVLINLGYELACTDDEVSFEKDNEIIDIYISRSMAA